MQAIRLLLGEPAAKTDLKLPANQIQGSQR